MWAHPTYIAAWSQPASQNTWPVLLCALNKAAMATTMPIARLHNTAYKLYSHSILAIIFHVWFYTLLFSQSSADDQREPSQANDRHPPSSFAAGQSLFHRLSPATGQATHRPSGPAGTLHKSSPTLRLPALYT